MLGTTENNRKWWILAAAASCLAMIYVDQTAVVVALPQLHIDLGLSEVQQQWVINSYLLVWAVLILISGKLVDLFGNRKMFLLGISGFLFASILCGVAPNGIFLITVRFIQGAFGAMLSPNTAIAIINAFPAKQRGIAMGTYSGSASIFMALGPLLGGFFTQFMNWRYIFLANIPFCLFALIFILSSVRAKDNGDERKAIDWLGFMISGVATAALVIAIMEGVNFGWESNVIIGLFILALLCYLIFIFVEHHVATPLIDISIFKQKNYLACSIIGFCIRLCSMARIFLVLFFQLVLGYTPFLAGLLILPAVAPTMVAAPLSGKLLDRFGARVPIIIGLVLLTVGLILTSIFAQEFSYWKLFVGILLIGIGLPLIGNPTYTVALSTVSDKQRGMASGGYNQSRYLGGTVGLALIGAIIANFNNHFFITFLKSARIKIETLYSINVSNLLSGSETAKQTLASLPSSLALKIHHFAEASYMHAFEYGMATASIFALIALSIAILKIKK
jgi:EmrB/QacA subfamily drug resistance transporter